MALLVLFEYINLNEDQHSGGKATDNQRPYHFVHVVWWRDLTFWHTTDA